MCKFITFALVAATSTLFAGGLPFGGGMPGGCFGNGNYASATASASVCVIAPLCIIKTQDMGLGAIVPNFAGEPWSIKLSCAKDGSANLGFTGASCFIGHFTGQKGPALKPQFAEFAVIQDSWANVCYTLPAIVPMGPGVCYKPCMTETGSDCKIFTCRPGTKQEKVTLEGVVEGTGNATYGLHCGIVCLQGHYV